jgi:hypothetical protein
MQSNDERKVEGAESSDNGDDGQPAATTSVNKER